MRELAAGERRILLLRWYRFRPEESHMASLKITVNRNRCVGSGDCAETAPGVFQLGDDEKSEVINPAGAPEGTIVAAARACPVRAITVVNEDTGVQVFPPPKN